MSLLVTLANAIVQAIGTDLYAEARKVICRGLGRLAKRSQLEIDVEDSRKRLSKDSSNRGAEIKRWNTILEDLAGAGPDAEHLMATVLSELVEINDKQAVRQMGYAGRDQYNIIGHPTIINR